MSVASCHKEEKYKVMIFWNQCTKSQVKKNMVVQKEIETFETNIVKWF